MCASAGDAYGDPRGRGQCDVTAAMRPSASSRLLPLALSDLGGV